MNSRPVSRGKIRSPMMSQKSCNKNNRYNILNLSKISGMSISTTKMTGRSIQSSNKKLFNRRESEKKMKRGRELQKGSSMARFSLKSESTSVDRNKKKQKERKSKIIRPNFSISEYLISLQTMARSKIWSDRYEVCSKLIQIIKDQYSILQKDKSKGYNFTFYR